MTTEKEKQQNVIQELEEKQDFIRWQAWHITAVTNFLITLWDEKDGTIDKEKINLGDLLASINLINQESRQINEVITESEFLIWKLKY